LIGAVALIVIGPKDLPKVMGTLGRWIRQARLLAGEFQRNLDEMVREADVEEVRRQMRSITPASVQAKAEEMMGAQEVRDSLRIVPDTPALPPPQTDLPAVALSPEPKPSVEPPL
jgi:sec-independent protein translocase protein TatB